ncbi:MAG TPA: heme lyase CcmF/NrfE family subunit [Gammaproteobacteria bacterium]|nr:heme lyase CcmF/NrfE family subunit [Gammaproteobacteria bacterium]
MITELGHFSLVLALGIALVQAILPIAGAQTGNRQWMSVARPAAQAQFVLMSIAFFSLVWAFVNDDFSLLYVASNSNAAMPTIFKVSAVWGAHEGSLLLWAFILSIWSLAVTLFSRSLPLVYVARVLGIMGMVSIGFLLFMLLTSNPFEEIFPAPFEGRELNPLLQDPGLAIHPPMLYMGYVGFSVAFAFAIAALLGGRLDAAWARWSRPWTTAAWIFLTIGIVLGSWWAYYELGWGGWWFWDPVENASFMPWLVGTALIHSLAVTEKRDTFKAWTVLLAIFAFSLSLLGTFLVRSGVLTSVHAFATDPERGLFILIFLGVVIGGSLVLYAWRGGQVRSSGNFALLSRESLMLFNNVFLVVLAAGTLLGTLFPLIVDAFGGEKVSVGKPWFNLIFMVFTPFLIILTGLGPLVRWKSHDKTALLRELRLPVAVTLLSFAVAAVVLYAGDSAAFKVALGLALAIWVVVTLLYNLAGKFANRRFSLAGLRGLGLGYWGMWLAHFGIAAFITGVVIVSAYSSEDDVTVTPGQTAELAGYRFRFEGVTETRGPNYVAERGTVFVYQDDELIAELAPEKRIYSNQGMPMTEAAIDSNLLRDVYVSLGERLPDGKWLMRIYHKPLQSWIWWAGGLMALGGIFAASDRRYRRILRREERQRENAQALLDELLGSPATAGSGGS